MALTQISTNGIKNSTITGTDLATNIDLVDNQKLRLGTGNDLQIFHNGTHTFIQESGSGALQIRGANLILDNADGSKRYIDCNDGGSVELYHDGNKKFETTSAGATVSGDLTIDGSTPELLMKVTSDAQSHRIKFFNTADSQVARIFGDPSTGNLSLQTGTNGAEEAVKCIANGAVELYHNNVKKFETSDYGSVTTGVHSVSNGILELKAAIATSHTLTTDYNAIAVDPTINNGVTVTVPSGATWAIV